MAFKLKTSKKAEDIFNEIESSVNLPWYTLVKLAMALSIKQGPVELKGTNVEQSNRDLNRQTITGDADVLYKCLIEIVEELKVMMETHPISDIVRTLVERTNYIKMLEDEETQDARNRIENIHELIKRAEYFEETASEPTLEKFLEDIVLTEDTEYNDEEDVVKLMTINVTKGEEFDTVFLGCKD